MGLLAEWLHKISGLPAELYAKLLTSLDEFARCSDIDFAYPTQRFYNNCQEGKSVVSGQKQNSVQS